MLSAPADQLIHPFRATLFANAHTAHRPLHASLELFPAPSYEIARTAQRNPHRRISGEDFLLQELLINRNFHSFRTDAISVLQNQRLT